MDEKRGGYWDDFRVEFNKPYRPATLIDVLCRLKVNNAPESVQVEAVRAWLLKNDPSDALRRNFARKGGAWPSVLKWYDRGPETLAELLQDLGIEDADDDEQFEAVCEWWSNDGAGRVRRPLWRDVAAKGGRWFEFVDSRRSMNAPMFLRHHPAPTPQERTATRRKMEAQHNGRFRQLREAERRHYIEAGLTPPNDLDE
ncbi:hypothetical protein ACFWCF_17520 [Rhodococcus sp. NPDC060090]|uniref:hypothetical protein n=1 Tax=Rhodococcus sp. NPDC060090 TaxID=3347056 RepID=UPI003665BE2F